MKPARIERVINSLCRVYSTVASYHRFNAAFLSVHCTSKQVNRLHTRKLLYSALPAVDPVTTIMATWNRHNGSREKRCGLLCPGKNGIYTPVPLKSIDVRVTIKGFVANVTSTFRYVNAEENPIEAVYEFPQDDRSAVYEFEARIEDRVIVAECQEKQQAKETYDDAIESGMTAMLLEEDDSCSDIFRCLVGNLPASTEAVVKMSFVTELSVLDDGVVQFVLPTQLRPRYNPSVADGGSASPSTPSYVQPGADLPYSFAFAADVISAGKILRITSGSGPEDDLLVELSEGDKRGMISLTEKFSLDHDIAFRISYDEPFKPHAIIEKGTADKAGILRQDVIMLNFFPELKTSVYSNKHEFVFVVDRSGSMAGSRIDAAKETLLVFLKSLPPGCYFNIVGFGYNFDSLFQSGSREYNEESLKLACSYQQQLTANMGGTEILRPLQHVYSWPLMSTHSRQILVMTDGCVSNQAAVIDLVQKNAKTTRLFTFGIGDGVSTALVEGIARAGRGKAEFVRNMDTMQAQVTKLLKVAMQACVTDIKLDWHLKKSPKLVQVPRQLPPIFGGDRLIVYAFGEASSEPLAGQVSLKCKVSDREVSFEMDINGDSDEKTDSETSLPVHRLAARAEIKQLEDSDTDGSLKNKSAILLLSTSTNIVCKHTSMVGVDKDRKEPVKGTLQRRHVPRAAPIHSCHYIDMQRAAALDYQASSFSRTALKCKKSKSLLSGIGSFFTKRPAPIPTHCHIGFNSSQAAPNSLHDSSLSCASNQHEQLRLRCDDDDLYFSEAHGVHSVPARSSRPPPPHRTYSHMSLVRLQMFRGSWRLDEELATVVGIGVNVLQQDSPVKSLDTWATIIAVAVLRVWFSDKKDAWEMIETKAIKWLGRQDLEGHSVEDLIAAATVVIESNDKKD